MADLHKLATGMFTFPVSSTGLKALGDGVGFGRKQIGMDAFGAYLAWRRDPAGINMLEYNRDDCEAMISVLDWLRTDGESWRPADDLLPCPGGRQTRQCRGLPTSMGRARCGTINFPVSGLGTGGALPRSGFRKTGRRLDRNDQLNPITC